MGESLTTYAEHLHERWSESFGDDSAHGRPLTVEGFQATTELAVWLIAQSEVAVAKDCVRLMVEHIARHGQDEDLDDYLQTENFFENSTALARARSRMEKN